MIQTFNQAIRNTLDQLLEENPRLLLLGLGITDPKRFFGTTDGLVEKFGDSRILECPTSENAYLGHALGLALGGYSSIVHFQRMDFMLYAFDQLVNNIAKWRDMLCTEKPVPIVIRSLVGMGWGQGAQHSQNLAPILSQIPGLKVVVPSDPESASRLLQLSHSDVNPVIFVEHRWLQYLSQDFDRPTSGAWELGKALIRRQGKRITIAAWSYGVVEALRFCSCFPEIDWEVIDLLSLAPLDTETVAQSFRKTRNLIVWEPAWSFAGIGSELLAGMAERSLAGKVLRIGYPKGYPAASPAQVVEFYPTLDGIVSAINEAFSLSLRVSPDARANWPIDQDRPDWNPWV